MQVLLGRASGVRKRISARVTDTAASNTTNTLARSGTGPQSDTSRKIPSAAPPKPSNSNHSILDDGERCGRDVVLRQVVHEEESQDCQHDQDRHPDQAAVLDPDLPPPNSGGRVWLPPPIAPNRPKVMTKGSSTCITLTPTLPRPALSPREVPAPAWGRRS